MSTLPPSLASVLAIGRTQTVKAIAVAALLTCKSLGAAQAAEELPTTAITSSATGTIELSPQEHSPLYAAVEGSPELTLRLHKALTARGFELAKDAASAKSTLVFRGDLAIVGGPDYVKGVKVGIGDAVEKSLQSAQAAGGTTTREIAQSTAAIALNKATFDSAVAPFWRGLAISGMASALGEATGVKGQFNRAVAGDPRGICLSRCEDWNKVSQTVYLRISLQTRDAKKEVRVVTKAWSETVAPDRVLDRAMMDGATALTIAGAGLAEK